MSSQIVCIELKAREAMPSRKRDLVLMHLHESIRIASEMGGFKDFGLFNYFISMSAELVAETGKGSPVRPKKH
ncbi:hypothetical protein [Chelativorans xinjiangense]|uniref:hypothetical protein n=1 Tax=Chelativorans xinjiangense TaxID=2681485 RepID=UPI0013593B82|nr:hypothetical protein [Chelativorans xinjiangense]